MVPLFLLAGVALLGAPAILAPQRERRTHRDMAGSGNYVSVAGYECWYDDSGPAMAAPIVIIHGFSAWAPTWEAQRQALLAHGQRVIRIDMVGSGASERALAPTYATDAHAMRLAGLLDQLGIQRCTLVGHSFGGRVAMQLALDAPERVQRLVVIAPEAFAEQRPPIAALVQPPVFGYALAFYATAPALVRSGLGMTMYNKAALTDALVATYARPLAVRGSTASQVWQARSPKDGARPVPQNLAAINTPTTILWGEHDPIFPAADGQRLAATMPNATLTIIPGVGHLPHHEDEAATTAALLAALIE